MRRLALILLPLSVLACDPGPAAPVDALAAHVAIHQATGSWDIYVYDVSSGTTTQVTTIAGADEWNAAFSHNGKSIVHEVIGSHDLYITRIATGVSTPLAGGEGGNDADWSPSGRLIAFDGDWGDPHLYIVPASGGTRTLVRAYAMDPQWGLDDHFLVFRDYWDWSVRTIDLRSGSEHVVAAWGIHPAWSTDGRHIAYTDGSNIFVVAVDPSGAAVGAPVQVTPDPYGSFTAIYPSWSMDSRNILFLSNRFSTDFDIWVVSKSGGEPTKLFGTVGEFELDPTFYGNTLVAFSKFTPPGP
ncbi:MAG: hypothetical protein OEZ42_16215 [Gemmatimonadota bacterium]|nr:hypothetical protein [Gemmatimonadota bacterium]